MLIVFHLSISWAHQHGQARAQRLRWLHVVSVRCAGLPSPAVPAFLMIPFYLLRIWGVLHFFVAMCRSIWDLVILEVFSKDCCFRSSFGMGWHLHGPNGSKQVGRTSRAWNSDSAPGESSHFSLGHSLICFAILNWPSSLLRGCGRHDMGWPERKVFGKIRYMNYAGESTWEDTFLYNILKWLFLSFPMLQM